MWLGWSAPFSQFENAIVQFSRTGKLNLGGLWQYMADEFLRQQARMVVASSSGQGGLLSSVINAAVGYFQGVPRGDGTGSTGNFARFDRGYIPQRASGGSVSAGGLYEVNENGPELLTVGRKNYLMMGGQSGYVTPNGSGGGNTYVVVENRTSAQPTVTESRRSDGSKEVRVIIEAVRSEMARDVRAAGDFANALQGTYGLNRAAGVAR